MAIDPPAAEPPAAGSPRRVLWMALLIVAATLAAYWPVTGYDFTNYDDQEYVTENLHVRDGLTARGVAWAFSTGHASNWHPLTWMSHMLDVQLFGLRAGRHHATNLALHALTAGLLFLVLRRMTGATWRSFFVAALFALHPTHVESVAWVAERKDVLSALFAVLTLGAYAWYVEARSLATYVAVLILFALGLMAKPMLVTLPFLLLLLDVWPLGRLDVRSARCAGLLVLEKVPLFVLSVASCVITIVVQKKAAVSFEAIAFVPRLGNAVVSYGRYVGKLVWPAGLSVFYAHPVAWPLETVLLAGVLLAALMALAILAARQAPYVMVGWLWYLGALVPVIGLVQVGRQAMADRYTYLPSIGLFLALVWGAHAILSSQPVARRVGAAVGLAALGACFALTRHQVGFWRDPVTLWSHAVAVDPAEPVSRNNLGSAKQRAGDISGAIAEFDRAIQLDPGVPEFHNNRGVARRWKGNYAGAIADFDAAIAQNPEMFQAYVNRGQARRDSGDLAGAIADYEGAIRLNPASGEAYNNLGLARMQTRDLDGAMTAFGRAIEVNPYLAEAFNNRAQIRIARGAVDRGIADYDHALKLDPSLVEAYFNRAVAKRQSGDEAGALDDYALALRVKPCYAEALTNRGNLLLTRGDARAALADYDTAVRCGRPNAATYLGRAVARRSLGDLVGAREDCEKALGMDPSLTEARALEAQLSSSGSDRHVGPPRN